MPLSKKVLEDSIRLARIRRIKMTLYVVQAVMLMALAFLLIFVIGQAKITPSLYLPIDAFVAVMVLLLLVICLEYFFFRMIEIRLARSTSAKHLMAKNSIERSILIAIIAAVITVVLMVQPILATIEDASSKTSTISGGEGLSFWSRDPLALQRVIELEVSAQNPVEVYLVEDSVYERYDGSLSEMFFFRINRDNYEVMTEITIQVPAEEHSLFQVVVNDLDYPGTPVTVVTVKEISDIFTGIVALLTLAFVVANAAWVAYLIPVERKYAQGSIYK